MSISSNVATFLLLFCLTGVLTGLFLAGYSGIGYGLEVIEKSFDYHDEASVLITILGAALAGFYIFDAHRWPLMCQELLAFLTFLAICASLLLLVSETPFGPLCVFSVLVSMLLVGIKHFVYPNTMSGGDYTMWIYRVLVTQGTLVLVGFLVWTTREGNLWDAHTRAYYSDRSQCHVSYEDLNECRGDDDNNLPCFWKSSAKEEIEFSNLCTAHCLDVYEECEEAFFTWANPGLAALTLFVLGFTAKYLKPDDPNAYHGVSAVARAVAVFLFLFWVFASMVGAGDGLSNSLIAFSISLFIGCSFVTGALFWQQFQGQSGTSIKEAVEQAKVYQDVLKGLVILTALPLVVVYLLLSIINQRFRRLFVTYGGRCFKYSEEEKNHHGWFTKFVADQVQDFLRWDHAKVLTYAVYWGFGYIFMNVLASKFTTLFLSWLIEVTATLDVGTVTGIVTAVGMVLFMLPPIPGIPIYLTAGIVLVSVGEESMGLWMSILFACFVSLMIKIVACAVQQKVIGELFGKSVSIRQIVGVNSEGIRAMRVVLSEPKLTANKVYILVGGPDWPVGVLCGILGLDVFPILIGTLPVVLMIVPTVLTGSFAFMGSIEDENGLDYYPWADTMATTASACIAAFMFFFMMQAAGAVKDTFQKKREEIDAIPLDEEVQKADELAAKQSAAYSQAIAWEEVPLWAKTCLILAVASMIACCILLVGFNTSCFVEYDLMYTINEHLGGKWYNLVKPLGRIALLLTVVSYAFLKAFQTWAQHAAAKILESSESGETKPLLHSNIT